MVFIALPLLSTDVSLFTQFTSTLPFPSVPFQHHHWRFHLCNLYLPRDTTSSFLFRPECIPCPSLHITIIDTRNKGKVLLHDDYSALESILRFGPHLYPFTEDREQELRQQFDDFGRKDIKSLQYLLGSDSRNYLLDRDGNKVLISLLEAYDFVALFAYSRSSVGSFQFQKRLAEIYNKRNSGTKSFEIVFIDLMTHSPCSDDEESFNAAFQEMPWLTLPFGDEKTWILANMFTRDPTIGRDYGPHTDWEHGPVTPLLFIKPKGEARLELYGYNIIDHYGEGAYPFTERALTKIAMDKLQQWTFSYFEKQAAEVGLDFNRLVRYKTNEKGEKEEEVTTLSSSMTMRERPKRGLILLFAALGDGGSKKSLDSLSEAYRRNQNDESSSLSSSFEVIFVSINREKTRSVVERLSNMPWLVLQNQPVFKNTVGLMEKTENLLCFGIDSFITFDSHGKLTGAGPLEESFKNPDFPRVSKDEFEKHVGQCIWLYHTWWSFDFDSFHWARQGGDD